MATKKSDIEYEMSRFEEEISKLTPTTKQLQSTQPKTLKMNIIIPSSLQQTTQNSQYYQNMTQTTYNQSLATIRPMQSSYAGLQSSSSSTAASATNAYSIGSNLNNLKRDSSVLGNDAEQKAKKLQVQKDQQKDQKDKKKKKYVRMAGGQKWEDETLNEWDPDDFRLFCGDLGNEVTDELLARAFQKYPSFVKAKVVRDKRTSKTKGYGFVSFKDSQDFIKAMREMNGKYVGNRPIKLRKSNWKDRNLEIVKKKEQEKAKMGLK